MPEIDLSKYGQVVQSGVDLSKYGQVVSDTPGVPNPLHANPDKYTPAGLQLAPWGVPSSGPHKSFADTFGHDTTAGKAADFLSQASNFLPSTDAMIGAAAPGVAGPAGFGGTPGLIKRAITLGGGMATQWGVEKGLRAMGVPAPLVRVLSDAAGFGVASRGGHGTTVERPALTADLGTTAPMARIPSIPPVEGPLRTGTIDIPLVAIPPIRGLTRSATKGQVPPTVGPNTTGTINVPPPPGITPNLGTQSPMARGPISPVQPLNVSPYSASGGTVEVPPTAPTVASIAPSLDELTAGQTGGGYKKFPNAPADVQGNIIKLHNRFAGQQPTPKPVPTTAAPPVVEPPPAPKESPLKFGGEEQDEIDKGRAMRAWAAKKKDSASISQPLGKVAPQDRETNLVNMLRANTTRKNLEIGQYFAGKNLTPEAVATMPEAEFNAHIRNVKNASGNPYEPSTGRNYHRSFEQARAEVVKAMQEMMNGPVPPPPPPQ